MLKLWGRVNSLNVQKVLWALAEVGVAYERIDAGMEFGVVKTPEYLEMNPNALVPTIDDGGLILWESNVIVRYLAARYAPADTLSPADMGERFRAERWMDWQTTALTPAIAPAFLGLVRNVPENATEAAIAAVRRNVHAWLAVLERQLDGRDFVNGKTFTMGDIPVGVAVNRWYKLPLEREPFPAVEAWYARLKERPGFATHVVPQG